MDRIVTARATAQQLLLTRLVIHPVIWGLITLLFTHTARHIGGENVFWSLSLDYTFGYFGT